MNLSPDYENLEISYSYCLDLCRMFHSSFFHAFYLLPSDKRRAMCVLYAFNRLTDDLADTIFESDLDGDSSAKNAVDAAILAFPHKKRRIAWWRSMTKLALQYDFTKADESKCLDIPPDTDLSLSAMMLYPALADTVARYQIPGNHLLDVIDGVEMDLTKNRYQNFAELETYCERVASSVGLACIHIWGFEGRGTPDQEKVLELARRVGIAYQMTNILRDLKEDAARDRVYLPLDELVAAGYSAEELKNGVVNSKYEKHMRRQIERAEEYYRASHELYDLLKPEGRKIFGLMTATYYAILRKISAHPAAVFKKRLRPGILERLLLAYKWSRPAPREFVL